MTLGADAVACVENCFHALAGGAVIMPPILRLDIAQNNGEVDVKTVAGGTCSADDRYPELGEVVAGDVLVQRKPEDITLCDLTGTGSQDTAIATLVSERAARAGLGSIFTT